MFQDRMKSTYYVGKISLKIRMIEKEEECNFKQKLFKTSLL